MTHAESEDELSADGSRLNQPIADFLPSLSTGGGRTAPYLGNLWRPGRTGVQPAGR